MVIVPDDDDDGRVDASHAAIQGLEAEAVCAGAVDKMPGTSLGARRQVLYQLQPIRGQSLSKQRERIYKIKANTVVHTCINYTHTNDAKTHHT